MSSSNLSISEISPGPSVADSTAVAEPKIFRPPLRGQSIDCDGKYYFIGDLIGQGYFGNVYECTDEWSNHLAAKVLVPRDQTYEQVRENWLGELRKLETLRHPNITYVHGAFECNDTFYLVIERCAMTLETVIAHQGLDPDAWIPYVARDVLQGLEYIHANGYIHKDIHAGNVFVFQSQDRMVPTKDAVWSFKIGDLGISRIETEIRAFSTLLAQWMLPPEVLDPVEFGQIGRTLDIYHVGLLLLALILKRAPTFTREEVLAGVPRQMAEGSSSRFGVAVAHALRRHTASRTPTAMHFWREIFAATQNWI